MSAIRLLAFLLAAFGLLAPGPAVAAARGVGATLPEPAYARWAALFAAETRDAVSYQGSGSGAGVTAIEGADAVAFAGTDIPLDRAHLEAHALVQFPTLVAGIVPVVDLPGIAPGDLVLDGPALAGLFMGDIAFWDDAAVSRLNPHLPLPHLAVTPVRRSDNSGTTAVFAAYLAAAGGQYGPWLSRNPPELRPIGPAAEGSNGMADAVAATPGAIGYVGFDFAQASRLTYVDLVNSAGRVVQPTLASIAAAAEAADWSSGPTPSLIARPGGASWPIATATYVLMRRTNADDLQAWVALRMFGWATRFGGPAAQDLGFTLPPERVEAEVRLRLREIHDTRGRSLAPADVTDPSSGASP